MLLVGVELKFAPRIVTVAPTGAAVGLNELITGAAPWLGTACNSSNPYSRMKPPETVRHLSRFVFMHREKLNQARWCSVGYPPALSQCAYCSSKLGEAPHSFTR